MIVSEATPDKNKLTTRTLTYDNIENNASYSAGSSGLSYRKFANVAYGTGEGYNMKGLTPGLSVPARGNADSTTTSAIAPGTIEIRENKAQDISALSRDTANSLNKLGRIFDKAKIEEQQELAAVFGEEAFRLAHNLKDDGSGRKIAIHIAIGGIMSAITGAGFASGAIGAGLNEALINAVKGQDPGTAQIVSAVIGAAAAKAIGGNATAGASAAASGTKWNYFLIEHPESFAFDKLAQKTLKRKDGKELSEDEVLKLLQGVSDIFAEHEPVLSDAWNGQSENIKNYKYVVQYLMNQGITGESANDFLMSYNTYLREQIDWNVTQDAIGYFDASDNYVFKRSYNQWIQAYPPAVFTGENLVLPNTPLTTHEKKTSPGAITTPRQENHGGEANDQSKAALGKTIGIETFKAAADIPVTLYNKYHDNPVKALKIGIFAPLGFGYDMYQDYGKYSGTDLAKVTLINSGAFAFSSVADAWLIGSAGMSVEATIVTNTIIVETADKLKKIWARSDEEKRRELP